MKTVEKEQVQVIDARKLLFLEVLAAMDVLEVKELHYGAYIISDRQCAIGALLRYRGGNNADYWNKELMTLDLYGRSDTVRQNDLLGISEDPKARFIRMKAWLEEQVKA